MGPGVRRDDKQRVRQPCGLLVHYRIISATRPIALRSINSRIAGA
jgi:hypothetical protein